MRTAAPLALREGDEAELRRIASARSAPAGLARRARIVLLAAAGLPHTEVAERAGSSVPTVRLWRSRYGRAGIKALGDAPRSGRPRSVDEVEIVVRTLERPPKRLGVTHWSSRLLAKELKVAPSTVVEVWRSYGLQPWRTESFKFSTDPELEAKVRDVVGLYAAQAANVSPVVAGGGAIALQLVASTRAPRRAAAERRNSAAGYLLGIRRELSPAGALTRARRALFGTS